MIGLPEKRVRKGEDVKKDVPPPPPLLLLSDMLIVLLSIVDIPSPSSSSSSCKLPQLSKRRQRASVDGVNSFSL